MRHTRNVTKTYQNEQISLNRSNIPSSIIINNQFIMLKDTAYHSKSELIANKKNRPFVEISENSFIWLRNFAEKILTTKTFSKDCPLCNSKLDYELPAPSALRLYTSDMEFIHIQIEKLSEKNSLFQLNYYELDNTTQKPELLMIIVVDIKDSKPFFRNVYLAYISPKMMHIYSDMSRDVSDLIFASNLARFFRFVQIYLRFWNSDSNSCIIMPLPEIGKNYEYTPESFPD